MPDDAPRRAYGGVSAEERQARRRARLLEVGREIWCEQGSAAVTMRAVCSRARITDRYFYENFADKDALLVAVAEDVRAEGLALILNAYLGCLEDPPLDQLRHVLIAVVDYIAEDPGAIQIFFGDHGGNELLTNLRREMIGGVLELFLEVATPRLADDAIESDLRLAVLLGIGGFVEIIEAWRAGHIVATPRELVDSLMRLAPRMASNLLVLD